MLHLLAGLLFGGAFCLAIAVITGMIAAEWTRVAAVLSGKELAAATSETGRIRVRVRQRRREFALTPAPVRPAPLRAAA